CLSLDTRSISITFSLVISAAITLFLRDSLFRRLDGAQHRAEQIHCGAGIVHDLQPAADANQLFSVFALPGVFLHDAHAALYNAPAVRARAACSNSLICNADTCAARSRHDAASGVRSDCTLG